MKIGSEELQIIAIILLVITIGVTIYYNNKIINSSNETLKSAKDILDNTRNISNWTRPEPSIKAWSNINLIGLNDTIQLRIDPSYSPEEGVKTGPIMWRKKLSILIFNSGRAPIAYPRMYIQLKADNYHDLFPFKIYKVETPLDKLYYDINERELKQSYESEVFEEYISTLPYWHPNEKGVNDFPPTVIDGKICYTPLLQIYQQISSVPDLSDQLGTYQCEKFGPFRIGSIKPGESITIEIELFGIAKDYFDEVHKYWTTYKEYASGNITIIIESENLEDFSLKFPIKSYFNTPSI